VLITLTLSVRSRMPNMIRMIPLINVINLICLNILFECTKNMFIPIDERKKGIARPSE